MSYCIPKAYAPKLTWVELEQAIKKVKRTFQEELSTKLSLQRVTAPLFVLSGTGLNDDLSGVERPVSFPIPAMQGRSAEIVHSLAKWKRMKLGAYHIEARNGLYTDMNAIRADEELDNIHSLYVDQWDWEQTINKEDRSLDYLKATVNKIYDALKNTETMVHEVYPQIKPVLPDEIFFIHSEDLLQMYPDLSSKERENRITEAHGAVFIIGIGGELSDGNSHDNRSPDYDDWSTPTCESGKYKGLNGDILLWNPILDIAFEISSMGVRVDKEALLTQLRLRNCENRLELYFHKKMLDGSLPLCIGGGIGQSRLCMFFLQCAHIGEVQASIWPEEMIEECANHGIILK